jgi:hypothetical protein
VTIKVIEKRRERQPQNRSWGEVVEMLLSIIHMRPVMLMCKGCQGEHAVCDRKLETHCMCGVVTRYEPYGLFHHWAWLTTALQMLSRHYNVAGDMQPMRGTWLYSARIVSTPLVNPQWPMDTRVMRWRDRSV